MDLHGANQMFRVGVFFVAWSRPGANLNYDRTTYILRTTWGSVEESEESSEEWTKRVAPPGTLGTSSGTWYLP